MPPTSRTKPSTRRLSDVAKYLVLPSGIVSTGYPAVAAQCRKLGIIHDDWQASLGQAVLAKRENGLYAAGIGGVVLSTCRQVGKTITIGSIIFALCILFPGLTVLWTAHHTRTSDETYLALAGMAQRPRVAPYVEKTPSGNGRQSIVFRNGSRILFGARERGFGRGIPGVAVVVFDEAQILTNAAINDMVPAANTVKNPLVLYMGTPPTPKDPSEVFKEHRRDARRVLEQREAGEDVEFDTLYVEIGADADADPNDRKQWAKGNPSYPARTPAESILRLRTQLKDPKSFLREGLGVWDEDSAGKRAISDSEWNATGIPVAPADGLRVYSVAFNLEGTRLALGGGIRHDAGVHVELIDAAQDNIEAGLADLADWLAARWRNAAQIVLSGSAGAPVLAQLLKDRGVPAALVKVAATSEYTTACSVTLDAVREAAAAVEANRDLPDSARRPIPFTHLADPGQQQLDDSVAVADKKLRGKTGAWGWEATTPDGDETPIEAISLAYWMAKTTTRSPYGANERRSVIL